jgi:hypothetical protein
VGESKTKYINHRTVSFELANMQELSLTLCARRGRNLVKIDRRRETPLPAYDQGAWSNCEGGSVQSGGNCLLDLACGDKIQVRRTVAAPFHRGLAGILQIRAARVIARPELRFGPFLGGWFACVFPVV